MFTGPTWVETDRVSVNGGIVGVTVNLPLSPVSTRPTRCAPPRRRSTSGKRSATASGNQVALDVWRAYQSLTTATQSLRTTADLVASAEQSERVALGRYKAGVGTVLDLLTAQSALAAARLQRIQAALDWFVYRATLAQAVGALDYTLLQPVAEGRP